MVEIQKVDIHHPHMKQILHTVNILKKGGVIVYPTDTIYGLAADILHKGALHKILQIKKVSRHKLMSLICYDLHCVGNWATVSNQAHRILRRVLPGKYTFILPISKEVPKTILERRTTVGVRIPDSPVAIALSRELGRPLLSTSVPKSNDEFFTDPHEIAKKFGNQIDLILDAGPMSNQPSTIVDFTKDPPQIIREGAGDIDNLF